MGAYDIATHFLKTEKALSNAIKVAMHHQIPLLAQQLTNLAKQKIESKPNKNTIDIIPNNQNNKKSLQKPSRSLAKLKRPSAKLSAASTQRTSTSSLIGKKERTIRVPVNR